MSKTPFYKTGISNSPFHDHHGINNSDYQSFRIDKKSGEDKYLTRNIIESNYTAMKNKSGTYASDYQKIAPGWNKGLLVNQPNKAGIQTQGENARFITGKEFESMSSRDIKRLGSQVKYYDERGELYKPKPGSTRLRRSQIRSKSHNMDLANRNAWQQYSMDAIDNNTRSFTRTSTTPKVKT